MGDLRFTVRCLMARWGRPPSAVGEGVSVLVGVGVKVDVGVLVGVFVEVDVGV